MEQEHKNGREEETVGRVTVDLVVTNHRDLHL
jgi:hypothetical protein